MAHPDELGHLRLPSTQGPEQGPAPEVLPLLAQVHARLVDGLKGLPAGPTAEWGPDHAGSPDPAAALLRERGLGFEWILVAFPGWSSWDLHLGVVPRGENVLALGLHWHRSLHESVPRAALRTAAEAVGTQLRPLSGEYHADLLVLAWRAVTQDRAAQVLSDAALELALALHGPLAHDLSRPHPPAPKELLHDL